MSSPRRKRSPEEKYQEKLQYHVKPKAFNDHIKLMVGYYHALNTIASALTEAVAKQGKGAFLRFTEQQGAAVVYHDIKKSTLREYRGAFDKALKELNKYFRFSLKSVRAPVRPESLRSTYAPVYVGESLAQFFSAVNGFGRVNPTDGNSPSLMASLSAAPQRLFLRNTVAMLFYAYSRENNLYDQANGQFVSPDQHMMDSFTRFSAEFYLGLGMKKKIPMAEAIQRGLVPAGGASTFQILQSITQGRTKKAKEGKAPEDISFNPQRFYSFYYQSIAALNYFSHDMLAAAGMAAQAAATDKPAAGGALSPIQQAMVNDHNLVAQASRIYAEAREQDPAYQALQAAKKAARPPKPRKLKVKA